MNCPVCRCARRQQSGTAFQLVKQVETKVCPFCRAYERVYGRKVHVAGGNLPGPPQGGSPPTPSYRVPVVTTHPPLLVSLIRDEIFRTGTT